MKLLLELLIKMELFWRTSEFLQVAQKGDFMRSLQGNLGLFAKSLSIEKSL